MIIEIVKDIVSFGALLALIIFGLSLIFLQFDRETSYNTHLLTSYRLLYSDYDLDNFESTGELLFFLTVIALVCIVLLNMLIALMGNTFNSVTERRVMVDSKELLELIAENMKIQRIIGLLLSKSSKKYQITSLKKYLFYAEQKGEEEFAEDNKMEDEIKALKEYMDEQFTHLRAFQLEQAQQLNGLVAKQIAEITKSQSETISPGDDIEKLPQGRISN